MATSRDIMTLVRILDQEGFGALAGELLTEINLGRELELADDQDTGSEEPVWSSKSIALETGLRRDPIPEQQQIKAAVDFLRLRLVEPVRHLAEAEQIASKFLLNTKQADISESTTQATSDIPIRIIFMDLDESIPSGFSRSEQAGEKQSADGLDSVLSRIAAQTV